MRATTMFEQPTAALSVDMAGYIGCPLLIRLNGLNDARPLFWQSFLDAEHIAAGRFLQSPGLPLFALLGQHLYCLPQQVRALLDATPAYMQFAVLQAMLLSRRSMGLALSRPLLFVLLVHHARNTGMDESLFQQRVCDKQHEIAGRMGLPADRHVMKILERTDIRLRYKEDLQAIMHSLQTRRTARLLRHVHQPSLAIFQLLDRNRTHAWLGASQTALHQISSRQQLQALHGRLVKAHAPASCSQLITQIGQFIAMRGRCSVGEVQRRFHLGYSTAVCLLDQLARHPA